MKRRWLAVAVAVAVVGIVWGAWRLIEVFDAERREAIAAVDSRRRVLETYAIDALHDLLARRLRVAESAIHRAEGDPLAPTAGLFARRDGRQTVPPRGTAAAHVTGAIDQMDQFADPAYRPAPTEADAGPRAERFALRAALIDAVDSGLGPMIERAMRAFLAHRARYVLDPRFDVPLTLGTLQWFAGAVPTDRRLMAAVLLDGAADGGLRFEGLQRTVLRERAAFERAEFSILTDRLMALCRRAEVDTTVFVRALNPPVAPPVPSAVAAPALVDGARWYVEPRGEVDVIGLRVDVPAELDSLTNEMRRRALLAADEVVRADPAAPTQLVVESPEWAAAPARARATWRIKLGLTGLALLMAAVAMALLALDARRRRRFLELKDDFIAAVSHELRTPLAAIRLMAETLERRLVDTPRARDYPQRIVREVDGLGFLVENLLSFNRVDKGRWVARTRPLAVGEVIHRVRETLSLAFDTPINWELDGIDDLELDVDPALFELLIANLARNAVQHGGAAVTIRISGRRGPPAVLRVADDGPGIAPEARRHIFEPFYRAPGRTSRGSGLGLALCARIMTLHGGRIALVDGRASGAAFELRF